MTLNPRFKISIQYNEGQEEWVEIMKQQFKDRLIQGKNDYFAIIEEEKENMEVSFIPGKYVSQKEFVESFEKNVIEPARKVAGLKQV
ncbi:hypothetical protein CEQ21_07685 (plasmid) [Niallia circulans]|uniref:Uncharacterized protein n=1 Tax=Niallia circulans TaxID=1397 RepID=A0A553SQH2_NIACI|nr:hypothetical protein [Niallia circulans]TRZ39240.1 hypothetical protein CEQ21_07685 [Niallia circulans]